MSALHMVELAWVITAAAWSITAWLNLRLRKTIRELREQLDLVWHEYEVACGTVQR